jgi:hypothetical protein
MFMSKAPMIHWIERSPYLHEARVTTADGADLYAGYIAVTPGAAVWRGYVGRGFTPLGIGPLTEMQAAVEQRVTELPRQVEADMHYVS